VRRRRASSVLVALSRRRRVHPSCGRGSFLSAPSRCSARRERVPCVWFATTRQPKNIAGGQNSTGPVGPACCLAVTGGCPYPTGWLGHPNHLQLPR
jgi:hypothetical protein